MNAGNQIIPFGDHREVAITGRNLPVAPDRVDLRGSLQFFRRRLRMIVAIVVGAVLLGAIVTATRPKVYTANAVVSMDTPKNQAGEGTVSQDSGPSPSSAYVDTQVEIITSRAMAERVATALGLLKGKSPVEENGIIQTLQGNVSAARAGESFALGLGYDAPTGEEASRTVNEFANQFTRWELGNAQERNRESAKLINERLEELRAQAHTDTEALQRYRIANNLLSTSGASLTEQEISSYNQEVTRARAETAEDQARLNTALAQLRSGSTGDDVGEALGSGVIGSLRAREAQVGGEVANMESRYGPNHPALVRAKGELAEIQRQIQAEIGRVISNLRAKQQVSAQRLGSLTQSLASARGTLTSNNAAMVGLDELERRAQVSQGLYETYLNTYKNLIAQEGVERPNARVLSLAPVPTAPSSPNVALNLVLAFAIGLGVAIASAFIAEALFSGISTPQEIETGLGIRCLASIPLLGSVSRASRAVPAILNEPRSAFAEAFRSLRISIEQATTGPTQVLAVTSALPKEGKTTIAACLAQSLALTDGPTILVDCDLRRRGVSRLLALPKDRPGLIEVLDGSATLDEAMIWGETQLAVLPIRSNETEHTELLTGDAFERLLDRLRTRFNHVLLDLPPVLPIALTRILASKADATMMVVRWRKTPDMAVASALQQLPPDRVNLVGGVLSRVDMRRRAQFGESDPAYYFNKYRQYYQ